MWCRAQAWPRDCPPPSIRYRTCKVSPPHLRDSDTTYKFLDEQSGARGGGRTHTTRERQGILSPPRMPFRHPGLIYLLSLLYTTVVSVRPACIYVGCFFDVFPDVCVCCCGAAERDGLVEDPRLLAAASRLSPDGTLVAGCADGWEGFVGCFGGAGRGLAVP
jgi:hypothetical protein